jgi:hypothetical protein
MGSWAGRADYPHHRLCTTLPREATARAIVFLVPLLVHWSELSGWLSSNPIYFCAGIPLRWSGQVLPGFPGWVDFHAGATLQAMGTLAARDWLHGIVPWWNPYVGIGLPLGAQLQSAPFFLPFVLLHHFWNGALYLKIAMQIIAGQATYLLLRHLHTCRSAAITGAILYELNGMFAWFTDVPIMPIAFLPVCVLGVERALAAARQGTAGGWTLITVAIAYLILAGFPETAYFCGLLVLSWALYRYAGAAGYRRAFARKVIGGGALGLMIAVPVLFAFASYLLAAWPAPRQMAFQHLPPASFAMYLFPYLFGPIHYAKQYDLWFHMGGYLGLCPFLLSVAGLLGGGRERGLRYLLAGWMAIALAKSAALPGVTELVNLIPVVTQSIFFRYIVPTIAFAASVMAALALDDWRRGAWRHPLRAVSGAVLVTILAAAGVLVMAAPEAAKLAAVARNWWPYPLLSLFGAGVVVGALVILLRCAASPATVGAICGVVVVEATILFTVPLLAGTRHNELDTAAVRFLQANLGLSRYYSLGPLGPNYGAYFGVASVNYNYLPLAAHWADFVVAELDPGVAARRDVFNGTSPDAPDRVAAFKVHMDAFARVGVKYVIVYRSGDPFAADTAQLIPVFHDPLVAIYQLPHPAPYFEAVGGACTLQAIGREEVRGHCEAPASLVRRELVFPGWRATLNSRKVPVHASAGILQSVDLPAGEFDLRFRYAPAHIGWTYPVCLMGLLGLAVGLRRWRVTADPPQCLPPPQSPIAASSWNPGPIRL